MRRCLTLLAAVFAVSALAAGSALARGAGGGGHGGGGSGGAARSSGGSSSTSTGVVSPATDAQDPIEWLTDYEGACKVAAEERRALLILITTEDLERTSQSCRFAGDVIRRAVRDAKVVPLKLLPPPALDLTGLKPEEAKKRQEVLAESRKKYEEAAKRFGVTTVPSVVYAAPDAAGLTVQASPSDDDIRIVLTRVPEMVRAHQDAVKKEAKKTEFVAAKNDPGKQPEAKPPEGKQPDPGAKPTDNAEDF